MSIRRACENAQRQLRDRVVFISLSMYRRIVYRTPVASGRLRSNWNIGVGAADYGVGAPPGSDPFPRESIKLDSWRPGQTIFITNSLPYARVVEYGLYGKPPGSANGPKTRGGYSTQAPAGMVRITLQDFVK